jgi:hypothetical protein
VVFPSPTWHSWILPRLCQDRFLPNPIQIILRLSSYHPTL